MVSPPRTSQSNSDAASATFGCSVNSGVAATYTPSLTTWLTRFNEPNCFFVSASTFDPPPADRSSVNDRDAGVVLTPTLSH